MGGPVSGGADSFATRLEAAAGGQDWAWSALHQEFAPRVRGFLAARGVGDPDDAVEEVFVLVARVLPRFEGGRGAFEVLVFSMARRYVADDPRRVAAGAAASVAVPGLPGHVAAVLDQLEPRERDALLLRLVGQLTDVQVGEVLGVPAGEADQLVRRSLASLSQVLF